MDRFFANVQKKPNDQTEGSVSGTSATNDAPPSKKSIPKGVVLGKDGKPCRSCTSFAAWAQMTKSQPSTPTPKSKSEEESLAERCPPDVEILGRSTWTFLHALSASYPATASPTQQVEMRQFLGLFSRLYPCWHCAEDFQQWMQRPGNEPRVEGQDSFGRWMCQAHNEVNRKLGKKEFDCGLWKERWKDGPSDGSCG